jgi:hypothetical protein
MTDDLSPNDLSHLSDKEFNALAPQGYHATGPAEPLSPAAQAVFWEFNRAASGKPDDWHYLPAIAAALRAAVDKCDPNWLATTTFHHLYAIADELEISTAENCITFAAPATEEVMRIDKEGFHYRGQFIADAGKAHRLMLKFLKQNTQASLAQPEPQRPSLMDIIALADEVEEESLGQVALVRRALARWGHY